MLSLQATIAYFSKDLSQTLQRLYPKPTATRTHYSASKGLSSTARQPQPTQPTQPHDNRRLPERPGAGHHDHGDAGTSRPTTQTPAPHDGPPPRPADHPDQVNGPSTSAPAVVTPTAPSDEKRRAFLSNVAKALCVWLHEKVEEQADALEFILSEIGVGAAMRLLAQTEEIELNAGGAYTHLSLTVTLTRHHLVGVQCDHTIRNAPCGRPNPRTHSGWCVLQCVQDCPPRGLQEAQRHAQERANEEEGAERAQGWWGGQWK